MLSGNTKLVFGWNGMGVRTSASWIQITFLAPKRLISFDQWLTAGGGNNSWKGTVVGIDELGVETVINTSVPLIGSNPLMINSPTSYKAYRLLLPANVIWGNDPAVKAWQNFIFA